MSNFAAVRRLRRLHHFRPNLWWVWVFLPAAQGLLDRTASLKKGFWEESLFEEGFPLLPITPYAWPMMMPLISSGVVLDSHRAVSRPSNEENIDV